MDLEIFQKKHELFKNDQLIKKMKRAQNLKSSLVKLSKISSRCSPTESPIQISLISNQLKSDRIGLISPRTNRQQQNNLQRRCKNCQKLNLIIFQQKVAKKEIQQKFREIEIKYSQIFKQREDLTKRIIKIQKLLSQTNQAIDPYRNNVLLMQQQLSAIKDSLVNPFKDKILNSDNHKQIQEQFLEKKKSMDFQFDFLKKAHQRQQQNNQTKMSRLNFVITYMQNKNKQLQSQNIQLERTNKILNGIIHQSGYVVQQRQLFYMASEQLHQVKMQYKKQKKEKQCLMRHIEKLKNKIFMLTSLIGYGVVSNIQNNDLHQLSVFRHNIDKLNKVQQKLTLDIYGVQSLKNYKSCYNHVKQIFCQEESWSCLYQSNFLIMFEDQQIKNALQQNVTTIVKPDFFLLIRAILDSKYSQFLIERQKTNRFQDFTYTFIDYFRLKKNQKRIQINSKINADQKDCMKTNFLLRVFDRKVAFLPEIITFRQFLIKNTPQDQIFYYLMCRNIIFNGPQLDNYINCSDPYNFVSYQRVLSRVQQILQHYDKSLKTIVFNHLNQKKIMKNKRLLIKSNYVIRLLLQIYRKFKKQKIGKMRVIFEQTSRFTKSDFIKFNHFKQILRKNFICQYYRKSMSIFHTHSQSTFFQAFQASCSQYIFLQENLKLNEQLKIRIYNDQTSDSCNYLMQLIPDSVSQIGNEGIYKQFVNFIKLKSINVQNRLKITQFLLKIINLRLYSVSKSSKQHQFLIETLDSLNNKLIDFINQNFKKRQRYEQSLEKASSRIGKQFKKKICQFYSEFIKDIKQQINNQSTV